MSIFPTGPATDGPKAAVDGDARPEADGVLVRPISGQIYLIEEADLEALSKGGMQSPLSGLVSRH